MKETDALLFDIEWPLITNLNGTSVYLPDILFLTCNPLCGLKGIISHHCGANPLTQDSVRSRETECFVIYGPLEHRVHMYASYDEERRGRKL